MPNVFLAENLDLFGMFDLNSRDADVLSPVDLKKVPQKSLQFHFLQPDHLEVSVIQKGAWSDLHSSSKKLTIGDYRQAALDLDFGRIIQM